MPKIIPFLFLPFVVLTLSAQDLEPFELTDDWIVKIEQLLPQEQITEGEKKNILIFSLHTGFEHWTIPHTEAVMNLLAKKSNQYNTTLSYDIREFEVENLKKYDAVILNNNCSIGDKRDLFWDKLKEDPSLNDGQRLEMAKELETNLLSYVDNGGGLMVLHGGIVMQNKSEAYGKMLGGSFDYHPKQQKIQVKLTDPSHPLLISFTEGGFEHVDEPYFFKNAYFEYNFKPLLYMETDKLEGLKEAVEDNVKYIAWIKKYGAGRIFYSSPSHNAQSFESLELLQFFARGMRYAAGDLKCDDSPMSAN
jgi:type 1 glutamine amidotransferase